MRGFFGRMKNEMYYGRTWQDPQELKEAIATYIEFYNDHRIKISLDVEHCRIPKSQCSVRLKVSKKRPHPLLTLKPKIGG
ncbi:IS3 family transposase [Corynebacterium diphtheriae]